MDHSSRPYRMTVRAAAAEATGEAILDAAVAGFGSLPFDRVTLSDIAAQSGVTVQTVIRRFGSKEELFEAVAVREGERIMASRTVAPGVGRDDAIAALVDHYEQDGDLVLHLIAQEAHWGQIAAAVAEGRRVHRDWVKRHCGALLAGSRGRERERRMNAAIAATDLYTWKLLRRDLNLERNEVIATMTKLLNGLETS